MFYQPTHKTFATGANNTIPVNKLVLGITLNGQSKAYPIQLIGYHHQVKDTVGNTPVMVTYCTVCRTGRVFSPMVNNQNETFRLVGMDHFNAMFEDATTKSWWQQATGVAVAGALKGTRLNEIPSTQMTLAAWVRQNPGSLIMQPDTLFTKEYKHLDAFDKGTMWLYEQRFAIWPSLTAKLNFPIITQCIAVTFTFSIPIVFNVIDRSFALFSNSLIISRMS